MHALPFNAGSPAMTCILKDSVELNMLMIKYRVSSMHDLFREIFKRYCKVAVLSTDDEKAIGRAEGDFNKGRGMPWFVRKYLDNSRH